MASDVVTLLEHDKSRDDHHRHPARPATGLQSSPRLSASNSPSIVFTCPVKREDLHSADDISVGCPSPSADASSDATDSDGFYCQQKQAPFSCEPEYYRPLKKLRMMHLSPQEGFPIAPVPLHHPESKSELKSVTRSSPLLPLSTESPTLNLSKSPVLAGSKVGVKSFSIMDILSHNKADASDSNDSPCDLSSLPNPKSSKSRESTRSVPPRSTQHPAASSKSKLSHKKPLESPSGSIKVIGEDVKGALASTIVRPWDTSIPQPPNTGLPPNSPPGMAALAFPRLFYNPSVATHSHTSAALALQSHFHMASMASMAHHVRFLPFHHHHLSAAVHPPTHPGLHHHHHHQHPLSTLHPGLSPNSGGRASSTSPYSSEGIGDTDVDVDELSSNTSDSPALQNRSSFGVGSEEALLHSSKNNNPVHSGSHHKNGNSHRIASHLQHGKKSAQQGNGNNGSPLDALFQMTSKTFEGSQGGPEGSGSGNHANLFSNRQAAKKKRKSRTAFSNHQIYELEKRFLYQKYLSPADRDEIALSLGLTNAQVITWFQNRRAKLKRDVEELKKDVEATTILGPHHHPMSHSHKSMLAATAVAGPMAEMSLLQQKADEYQQALQTATGE